MKLLGFNMNLAPVVEVCTDLNKDLELINTNIKYAREKQFIENCVPSASRNMW